MRLVTFGGVLLLSAAILGEPAAGQWLTHPTSGIPRTLDGRPNLLAPAPRPAETSSSLADRSADLHVINESGANLKGELMVPQPDSTGCSHNGGTERNGDGFQTRHSEFRSKLT